MNKMKECPCLHCRKVAEPEKCDNKDCALWRHWFIEHWDELRLSVAQVMAQPEAREEQP